MDNAAHTIGLATATATPATDQPNSASPFASRSILEHLVRGACAACLAAFAIWLISSAPTLYGGVVAAVALVGVVLLLRGCPTCWLIGLFETVASSARRRNGLD